MGGHPQIGDRDKIKEVRERERQEAMHEVARRKALELWPSDCPTCLVEAGQRCLTRNGKRALVHQDRIRPKTHIVHTKPGKDDMGFDVEDFANDEEARSYFAFLRDEADKHGVSPASMVSPGSFAMVLRWFKRNGD